MLLKKSVKTENPGLYEITAEVKAAIAESGVKDGLCVVYVTDADAAVMVTSFWAPKGHEDIIDDYNRIFPARLDYEYEPCKVKAAAHSKSAVTGMSLDVIISGGEAVLGSSQGIFVAEFVGGGKEREYLIKCM